jgi:hypothetical protein
MQSSWAPTSLGARPPCALAVLTALQSSWGSASSWLNLPTRSQSSRRCSPHGLRVLIRVRAVHRREGRSNLDKTTSTSGAEIDKTDRPATREEARTLIQRMWPEEWNPPIPEYPFVERARIADIFFGPDAESIDGKRTLARRIQVTSDLAALCKLCQPSRRGKPFN